MDVIWKYELIEGITSLMLPVGAKVLTVKEQNVGMYMWVMHDKDSNVKKEERMFMTLGTGFKIAQNGILQYVGTVHRNSGLVWHVFEIGSSAFNPDVPVQQIG